MAQAIFAGLTLKEIIIAIAVFLFVITVLSKLKKSNKREASQHSHFVQCDCGWQGTVSVYAGRCAKCNAPLAKENR